MMLFTGLHAATLRFGNAVLERGIGFTMLLGCTHGWCQWAGMATSEQAPWCPPVLHSHAPQLSVYPRSKIPQRGSGLHRWRQTTHCTGTKPALIRQRVESYSPKWSTHIFQVHSFFFFFVLRTSLALKFSHCRYKSITTDTKLVTL